MKAGAGKQKGSNFERKIAKELSLWISAGRSKDLLWRTALSGGRASTGKSTVGFGDIGPLGTSEESKQFSDTICLECKNYAEVSITKAFFNKKADLTSWWDQVSGEAKKANLTPMLIAKGNRQPSIIVLPACFYKFGEGLSLCESIRMVLNNSLVIIYKYDDFIESIKWNDLYKILSKLSFKRIVK